jgi:hypothetical protein
MAISTYVYYKELHRQELKERIYGVLAYHHEWRRSGAIVWWHWNISTGWL